MAKRKRMAEDVFEGFEEEVDQEPERVSKAQAKVDSAKRLQSAEMRRRELASIYKQEDKVSVVVSPLYKPYFGETMTTTINGITTVIPCNGKAYELPRSFACEVYARIARVDKYMDKTNKMSDIESNFETAPGELSL